MPLSEHHYLSWRDGGLRSLSPEASEQRPRNLIQLDLMQSPIRLRKRHAQLCIRIS